MSGPLPDMANREMFHFMQLAVFTGRCFLRCGNPWGNIRQLCRITPMSGKSLFNTAETCVCCLWHRAGGWCAARTLRDLVGWADAGSPTVRARRLCCWASYLSPTYIPGSSCVREAHATRAMPQASRVCLLPPLARRATQPEAE